MKQTREKETNAAVPAKNADKHSESLTPSAIAPEPRARSEGLLPAEGGDGDATGEGDRAGVAEEVSLDQQSEQARRVGRMPDELGEGGGASEAPPAAAGH